MTPLYHPLNRFQKRRQQLARKLQPNSDLLIYFNTSEKLRNYDREYSFRGDSSFLYLTGFPESQSCFVMWKEKRGSKGEKLHFQMFVLPKDTAKEQWTGLRYGPRGARQIFGATDAYEHTKLNEILKKFFADRAQGTRVRILTNALSDANQRQQLFDLIESCQGPLRRGAAQVEAFCDVSLDVQKHRLIKDADEIKTLRKATQITVHGHLRALELLRPGLFEYEVQAALESEFMRHGAREPAYNSIVASGSNATILHYGSNNRKMKAGEVLLIDAGAELEHYAGDITRTFPVSGRYNKEQRNIMDLVLDAHQEAIHVSRSGRRFEAIHEASSRCLFEGLLRLKLLKGNKKKLWAEAAHRRYFPHGTGHWLGLDVHDQCPYYDEKGQSLRLQAGMCFTVEPGLYFLPQDKSVPKEYRGIGVRIEDDILVRNRGAAEILTEGLPRSADEIEAYKKSHTTRV